MTRIAARVPALLLVAGLGVAAMCGVAAADTPEEEIDRIRSTVEPAEPICVIQSTCVDVCVGGGSNTTFLFRLCPDVAD